VKVLSDIILIKSQWRENCSWACDCILDLLCKKRPLCKWAHNVQNFRTTCTSTKTCDWVFDMAYLPSVEIQMFWRHLWWRIHENVKDKLKLILCLIYSATNYRNTFMEII